MKMSPWLLAASLLICLPSWSETGMVGKPAPKVPGLEQTSGPVLIDFWASWCGPCQESFPWMNQLKTTYPELTIIAVNLDEDRADAQKFLAGKNIQFDIVYDSAGALAEQFQVDGMPSSYLVNADGVIIEQHTGFFSDKIPAYEASVEALLHNETP